MWKNSVQCPDSLYDIHVAIHVCYLKMALWEISSLVHSIPNCICFIDEINVLQPDLDLIAITLCEFCTYIFFTLCFYAFYYWNKQRYVWYRHLLYLFIVKKTEKFRALQHNYNIVSTSRPSYFIISSKFFQFHSNCPGVFVVILSMRLVLLIESNSTDFRTAKQPVLCTMSNYIETGFLHLKFFLRKLVVREYIKTRAGFLYVIT